MSAGLAPAPDETRTSPALSPEPAPPRFPASVRAVMVNYASAAALLLLGFVFYRTLHELSEYYREVITPVGLTALTVVLVGYLLVLPLFYATFRDDYAVKCRLFWRAVWNLPRRRPTPQEAVALRAVAVKWFFMPLMISWLTQGAITYVAIFRRGEPLPIYDLILGAIILTDLFFFTIAYGVEHPRLKNEIRSVEPTFYGWLVALACYPPLQYYTHKSLGWYPHDHPTFTNPAVQVPVGLLMLALMATYTWASVALGLKASNLTNRGIIGHGPYRWVRHPAYVCKNLFWCVACLPLLIGRAEAGDWAAFGLIVLSLACWFGLYTLRAITEERHLIADPDYRAYCEKVKWRYVPGVW